MKTYAKKTSGVKPHGRPFCVRPAADWVWAWTLAECIKHFDYVPELFHLLDDASTVASVWHYLTWGMKSKLDDEFVFYDLRSGRC